MSYETFILIPLITILGYLFGKYTCGFQASRGYGFYTTIIVFALLNLIHSIIDGTLFINNNFMASILMSGHELVRQPILYTLFFGMISIFEVPQYKKIMISILSISFTWILGLLIGKYFIPISLEQFDNIAIYTYAFFIGDVLHHVFDYFYHKH